MVNIRHVQSHHRRGVALLLCLFVIALTSLLVISMLDTEVSQLSAIRNTADFERALYLAGAAVHHALARLEADFAWRGTVSEGNYPQNDSYSATAVDGVGGQVVITGSGVSGAATRTLQVTVGQGS